MTAPSGHQSVRLVTQSGPRGVSVDKLKVGVHSLRIVDYVALQTVVFFLV